MNERSPPPPRLAPGTRLAGNMASFAVAPEMLAHTFMVERYLRAVVPNVPVGATLCSYVQPGMETYYTALEGDELEAYRSLMATAHRDFAAFRTSWGALGFAKTALPRKIQYGKGGKEKAQRERYLRALFQWNRFFVGRKMELRYVGPRAGFGVFFRDDADHIMEVTDLAPLRGTVVEVSGAAMEHWFLRSHRFALVERALRYKGADGACRTRTLRGVLVGPMALINGACSGCFNTYSYVVGRREATEWRECQLARTVAAGSQILFYYGPEHLVETCLVCKKRLPQPSALFHQVELGKPTVTRDARTVKVRHGSLQRQRARAAAESRAPLAPYATRAAASVAGKRKDALCI